mmetsp:Transcript_24968/g.41614  ORF Transcript_24968/g.41614 Transcript_24968/m.41614 type:complete len:312 (-) Transcript_24968:849-1784(-)
MGAAASVRALYEESVAWFKKYFDGELYRADFEAMDKDHDGGISYSELSRWIKQKSDEVGGPWKVFLSNTEIIQYSHAQACSLYQRENTVLKKKVIGVNDFRNFLVHFYAISVLWIHFKHADEYERADDIGNLLLNMEEFTLAVKTMAAGYSHEAIEELQIEKDFEMLDRDKSGNIAFIEVCAHCCRYIDPKYTKGSSDKQSSTVVEKDDAALPEYIKQLQMKEEKEKESNVEKKLLAQEIPVASVDISEGVRDELESSSTEKQEGHFQSVDNKNLMALEGLENDLKQQLVAAEFAQVKHETEVAMKDLLNG